MTPTLTPATALLRAMTELARLELAAAAVNHPQLWGGTPWELLEPDNRLAMFRLAADRLGFGLRWPIAGLEDEPGQDVAPIPPARPGMLVWFEGWQNDPFIVRHVSDGGARVEFTDGGFLGSWPDLVESVNVPWPPFATAKDLTELEIWRIPVAVPVPPDDSEQTDDHEKPIAALARWAKDQGYATPGEVMAGLEDDPSLLGRPELAAVAVLATVWVPDASVQALDDIATLSGCPEWHYPGQVVRDVVDLMGQGVSVGMDTKTPGVSADPMDWIQGRLKGAGLAEDLADLAQLRWTSHRKAHATEAVALAELGTAYLTGDAETCAKAAHDYRKAQARPVGRYRDTDGVIGELGPYDVIACSQTFTPDGTKPPAIIGPGFPYPYRHLGLSNVQRLTPLESSNDSLKPDTDGATGGTVSGARSSWVSSRAQFILDTVGQEVTRACGYSGDLGPSDWFEKTIQAMEDATPAGIVEIRWWKDGRIKALSRYTLSRPDTTVFPSPDTEDGGSPPEGELPPRPGFALQVAIFAWGSGHHNHAVSGDPGTADAIAALDTAAAAALFPAHPVQTESVWN